MAQNEGQYILAIDAGTTNVLVMVVDDRGQVVGKASASYPLNYPAPGLVELDAELFWRTCLQTIQAALSNSAITAEQLAAIGITGQRTTIVIWDKDSGEAVGPAVIWQDQRGKARAAELVKQKYYTVSSITAAAKMEQLLEGLENGHARAKSGELAWGNIDSFLAWRLSGGALHVTDASNASTTGYFDYQQAWSWNEDLLALQDLPRQFFPTVVDSIGVMGHTDPAVLGAAVPIAAIAGDQQGALYGQACLAPGMAKISYGTSATCNVNVGGTLKLARGAYPGVAWTHKGEKTFLVEGMVVTAGAVFSWLTQLGIIDHPSEVATVAGQVGDSNGVSFLPALQGLGTPHNRYDRAAAFEGLSLATTKGHMVRAAMEGVAFRSREMLDSIYSQCDFPRPAVLRVDGGATDNDVLMQLQANVLGCPIETMAPVEATAFGVAMMAGEAVGAWQAGAAKRFRQVEKTFQPQWSDEEREQRFSRWQQVFGLSQS